MTGAMRKHSGMTSAVTKTFEDDGRYEKTFGMTGAVMINSADMDTLEKWSLRLLSAKKLDEVFH